MFQSCNLWSHKTMLENVIEAPIHVQKRPRADVILEAEALLEKVGVTEKRHHYPAHLSGGQLRTVDLHQGGRCPLALSLLLSWVDAEGTQADGS